jgi:hypothetical protein
MTTSTPKNTEAITSSPQQPDASASEAPRELPWDLEPDPVIPVRWRPYVPLAVFFITLWLMFQLSHELRYSWATGPVPLGDISNGCDPIFYQKAQNNSFVHLKNIIPDLESTTEARVSLSKYHYAFAMGCDLLLAVPAKRYQTLYGTPPTPKTKKSNKRTALPARPVLLKTPQGIIEKQGDLKTFSAQGRIMRLSEVTNLQPVRDFYLRSEHTLPPRTLVLFDGETPASKWWIWVLYAVFLLLCGMSLQRFFLFTRALEDDQAALEEEEAQQHQP